MTPRLTIAVTTHNRRPTLARCLENLWRTRNREVIAEVIVVDDGSQDDTPGYLEQAQREGLVQVVLRNEQAQGPAQGRNRALACAKAPFTLITGDDVLFFEDALGVFASHLREHDMSRASVLGNIQPYPERMTAFEWWSSNGGSQFGHWKIPPERRYDAGEEYFYTCNVVVPTELLRAHPFDERFRHARYEDRELAFRLARAVGHKLHYRADAGSHHLHPITLRRWVGAFGRFTEAALLFCQLHPEEPSLETKVGVVKARGETSFDAAALREQVRRIAAGYRPFIVPKTQLEAEQLRNGLGLSFRAVQEHFRNAWYRRHLGLPEARDPQEGIGAWAFGDELLSALPEDA